MRNIVLYFFLLMLRVLFNFNLDASYKCNRFFKTFLMKDLKFILNKSNNIIVMFNSSLKLLEANFDSIIEEQNCKKDLFMTCDTSHMKIILGLLTKIMMLYIKVLKVQVEIFDLKRVILQK